MYRKSVDYGQQSTVQISQFSVFKKKAGEQTPQIIIQNEEQYEFKIRKTSNSIILTVMTVDLMLQHSNKQKIRKPVSSQNINTNGSHKIFKDFIIENVPKAHYNYQHEGTLEQLLTLIYSKVKDKNLKQTQDLVTNFTVTQFVLNCYARKLIKNYIVSSNQLDLLGNQDELLNDYTSEIRGQLLQALLCSCKLFLTIFYKDAAGQLEDTYKQEYGGKGFLNRIEMHDVGQYYKVSVKVQNQQVKLTSVNSSQSILQLDNKSRKQTDSSNSTIEQSIRIQSSSASKDIRCNRCNAKGNCECDKTPKRIISRQISYNPNASVPSGPRSIFDSVGLGNPPKRQISTNEMNSVKR